LGKNFATTFVHYPFPAIGCEDSPRLEVGVLWNGVDVAWHGLDIVNTCYGVDYLVNRFVERLLFKCLATKSQAEKNQQKKKVKIAKAIRLWQ